MLLDIKISGAVQGVGFRYLARQKAKELGLVGFAANNPDGTVQIEIEGELEKLKRFLAWCEKESPGRVVKIEHEFRKTPAKHSGFEVR